MKLSASFFCIRSVCRRDAALCSVKASCRTRTMRPAVRKTGLAALSHLRITGAVCSAAGNASKIIYPLTLPLFTHICPHLYADICVISNTTLSQNYTHRYLLACECRSKNLNELHKPQSFRKSRWLLKW
jgi:hypothetical protein